MRRREFIAGLASAVAWPAAALAQQPANPIVGYVTNRSAIEDPKLLAAFRQGLQDNGYVEGQNVTIDYRSPRSNDDTYLALTNELRSRRTAAIVAIGDFAAIAAAGAPGTTPIVFVSGVDPIEYGLVPRLNRPGGHVTGVTTMNATLVPKRLELLH